jgi:hypothetical protein
MKLLNVRKYKVGYEVREELRDGKEYNTKDFVVKLAYTPNGDFIGDSKDAYFLCVRKGIKPEKAKKDHSACSIGFCEKEQKWFGWSHRAIYGYKIGDVVKKGDCTNSSGWTDDYLIKHPEEDRSLPIGFKANNLDDCKKMAIAFAESVS